MTGKQEYSGDYENDVLGDFTFRGSGFVIGNSFVFGTDTGFKVVVNLDYLIIVHQLSMMVRQLTLMMIMVLLNYL